jgi:hypothetical protein
MGEEGRACARDAEVEQWCRGELLRGGGAMSSQSEHRNKLKTPTEEGGELATLIHHACHSAQCGVELGRGGGGCRRRRGGRRRCGLCRTQQEHNQEQERHDRPESGPPRHGRAHDGHSGVLLLFAVVPGAKEKSLSEGKACLCGVAHHRCTGVVFRHRPCGWQVALAVRARCSV